MPSVNAQTGILDRTTEFFHKNQNAIKAFIAVGTIITVAGLILACPPITAALGIGFTATLILGGAALTVGLITAVVVSILMMRNRENQANPISPEQRDDSSVIDKKLIAVNRKAAFVNALAFLKNSPQLKTEEDPFLLFRSRTEVNKLFDQASKDEKISFEGVEFHDAIGFVKRVALEHLDFGICAEDIENFNPSNHEALETLKQKIKNSKDAPFLKMYFDLIGEVAINQNSNKKTLRNLSIGVGPQIVGSLKLEKTEEMRLGDKTRLMTQWIIENRATIFEASKTD